MAETRELPETNGRIKLPTWMVYLALTLLGWGVSAFGAYAAATASVNSRIAVLESRYEQIRSDISDIRNDVKELLRRR